MKKLLSVFILMLLMAFSVFAVSLVNQPEGDPLDGCEETATRSRIFAARTNIADVGKACGRTALVSLYNCNDDKCNSIERITDASKIDNIFPRFEGFNVGEMYKYICVECGELQSSCPIVVYEGELVKINWEAYDPDSDIGPQGKLTYKYFGVIGESGEWQTKEGDAGIYEVGAEVFDGEYAVQTNLCVEVIARNKEPILTKINDVVVMETETVKLDVRANDPDGDDLTIKFSGWMNSATKTTDYDDAGEYTVKVTVSDGEKEVSQDVKVTVENKNRAPVIVWKESSLE